MPGMIGNRYTKQEQISFLLDEINVRATRHKRGTALRSYLLTDLERIAELTTELKTVIESSTEEYWRL